MLLQHEASSSIKKHVKVFYIQISFKCETRPLKDKACRKKLFIEKNRFFC